MSTPHFRSATVGLVPPPSQPDPDVLYHYTSLSAMMNILRTRKIWASDIGYLNDVSERKLLLDLVDEHLPAFAAGRNLDSTPFANFDRLNRNSGPFVASFSSSKDSLNQWRSYCPIANGVSIGFKTACLRHAGLLWEPAFPGDKRSPMVDIASAEFGAVAYVEPGDPNLGLQVMTAAYEQSIRESTDETLFGPENNPFLDMFFRVDIETAASFYKHKGFMSEGEYRLVLPSVNRENHLMKFRCTRSSMVPYVELTIPESRTAQSPRPGFVWWDAVAEIVIGPTTNIDLTENAVWQFMRSIEVANIPLTKSLLPYRDW